MATTIGQLNREFAQRASAAGLSVDCLADGDCNAALAIVGEAPGPREVELRAPLVGGSGKFLWEVLAKFGIRRQHCYITNVVKKQLVDDAQTSKKGVSRNELSHWKALLDWELSQLPNCKHVLVLGDIALQAVVGDSGIEKWRGSVVGDGKRSFVIANNPALILRKPSLEPIFRLDISKLDMVMRGVWKPHDVRAFYDPSPDEAVRWCDRMIQEALPVSFDVEVVSNETACVGFANNAHEGMCINFRGREHNRWSLADESRVRRSIQRVLRHASVRLVAQNGGFDCGWLWYKDRIKARPLWIDTLLAHHTLHPTWPHNLGFLTAQYTTHPFYKDEKDTWREGGDISSFWEYNVKDVCITWEVARRLEAELKQQKMWDFFSEHVMRLQPHLVGATVLGNKIDIAMRKQLQHDFGRDVDRLREEFVVAARIAANDETISPNPLSPKQLAELFFQKLRLVGKNTSTNEENRNAMIESPRTPEAARKMLGILNEYKEQHKLLSTYIEADIDPDGRMRSDYKQFGTQFVPGRLSSSSTLWGSGMNLQNQPERLRGMFIADRIHFNE
jgi:DNA polymerase